MRFMKKKKLVREDEELDILLDCPILLEIFAKFREDLYEIDDKTEKIFDINGIVMSFMISILLFNESLNINSRLILMFSLFSSFLSMLIFSFILGNHFWNNSFKLSQYKEKIFSCNENYPDDFIEELFKPAEKLISKERKYFLAGLALFIICLGGFLIEILVF
ncbi:MAG: hypothetical protein ACTSRZ_10525 [Promethearchaeota archaeon]